MQEFDNIQNWHTRGFIPHYDADLKYQMITYRLADALPKENFIKEFSPGSTGGSPVNNDGDKIKKAEEIKRRQVIESYLDKGYGSCVLNIPAIARSVIENWQHFDGVRYNVIAYVIMPNHVHILIRVEQNWSLSQIVHSWKSYTAHKIKKILEERTTGEPPVLPGRVWQVEYWDRFIRDDKHFHSAINYIHNNPVKAGLCSHPEEWSWSSKSKTLQQ